MSQRVPNAQYNLANADSLAQKLASFQRKNMYDKFIERVRPKPEETVIDLGVTSDQEYASSNYFELYYPYKSQITACGIDDASFLESLYPGVTFQHADAVDLPFADQSFDLLHCAAVWEHVGSRDRQMKMLSECVRVARRAVFLTTPNRWFPVEMHTQVPLLHWLPTSMYRALYRKFGLGFFADEANLNLLSTIQVRRMTDAIAGWRFDVFCVRLAGFPSNIIIVGNRALDA